MITADQKALKIKKAILLVWSSLDSHLPYTHVKIKGESRAFHKKCVKEYSELLKILSELY